MPEPVVLKEHPEATRARFWFRVTVAGTVVVVLIGWMFTVGRSLISAVSAGKEQFRAVRSATGSVWQSTADDGAAEAVKDDFRSIFEPAVKTLDQGTAAVETVTDIMKDSLYAQTAENQQ